MASPPNPTPPTTLPNITLLCLSQTSKTAFQTALQKYLPHLPKTTTLSIHNSSLAALPATTKFDAIVSPANSYGIMDGAFDDAISVLLSPNPRDPRGAGYRWVTRKVQGVLYGRWRGWAPVGSCTVVDVRRDGGWFGLCRAREVIKGEGEGDGGDGMEHKHGCKFVLVCPTMRVPREVRWDREVVFECVWALLCAVDMHNRECSEPRSSGSRIDTILLTPLATGAGRISEARWAAQCVLAMKYWLEAVEQPEKWANLSWTDVYGEIADSIDQSVDL
ncbi:hypothetical protein EG328_002239 [Venturia inaequalis]|uniref:Macro domain-like protein n=1 Tax=Venturia inaequalis TaxID=5025 RepID=A0A8H3VH58_VENIN|nr:hypothetical protein EG328_002239 [Venturia inaequalis]RDI89046.1 hypothetical protein Vi05172_g1346 [Venturia inaequalis]